MTKREALHSKLYIEVPTNAIEKVLIDKGIDGDAPYTSSAVQEIDMAYVELLNIMITKPNFSEGKLSEKYNVAALKAERNRILDRYNMSGGGGIIDGTSRM